MSDSSDPKHDDHGLDTPVDPDALAALEAEVRALRNAPVEPATMARMRAGLDARIASSSPGARSATPISSHPRWRGAALLAAAAAAAAAFFLLLSPWVQPGLDSRPSEAGLPRDVAHDAGPPPTQQEQSEPAPSTRAAEDAELARPSTPVVAATSPEEAITAATDEELAIAIDYELLSDYDVIAQLDLLELLDDPRPVDGVGSPRPEGRI